MFLGNKFILMLLIFIFLGCDKYADCSVEDIETICFEGFNNIKLNKISSMDLKDKTNNTEYVNPLFISVDNGSLTLKINQHTARSIKNGFIIIINDTLKYKVNDVKMEEIYFEKNTMWGKIYGCSLKEYKLNDSLIESHSDIIIYR